MSGFLLLCIFALLLKTLMTNISCRRVSEARYSIFFLSILLKCYLVTTKDKVNNIKKTTLTETLTLSLMCLVSVNAFLTYFKKTLAAVEKRLKQETSITSLRPISRFSTIQSQITRISKLIANRVYDESFFSNSKTEDRWFKRVRTPRFGITSKFKCDIPGYYRYALATRCKKLNQASLGRESYVAPTCMCSNYQFGSIYTD